MRRRNLPEVRHCNGGTTDLPAAAITAATEAACEELDWLDPKQVRIAVELALEAAAPWVTTTNAAIDEAISQAADERERILQLATDLHATYYAGNAKDGIETHSFADLLREDTPLPSASATRERP